jgi:hypothetical protein
MRLSSTILDFFDPNMSDWKEELVLRDTAIAELFRVADAYHSMVMETRSPKDEYRDHPLLEKYRSFVVEMEKENAAK